MASAGGRLFYSNDIPDRVARQTACGWEIESRSETAVDERYIATYISARLGAVSALVTIVRGGCRGAGQLHSSLAYNMEVLSSKTFLLKLLHEHNMFKGTMLWNLAVIAVYWDIHTIFDKTTNLR